MPADAAAYGPPGSDIHAAPARGVIRIDVMGKGSSRARLPAFAPPRPEAPDPLRLLPAATAALKDIRAHVEAGIDDEWEGDLVDPPVALERFLAVSEDLNYRTCVVPCLTLEEALGHLSGAARHRTRRAVGIYDLESPTPARSLPVIWDVRAPVTGQTTSLGRKALYARTRTLLEKDLHPYGNALVIFEGLLEFGDLARPERYALLCDVEMDARSGTLRRDVLWFSGEHLASTGRIPLRPGLFGVALFGLYDLETMTQVPVTLELAADLHDGSSVRVSVPL